MEDLHWEYYKYCHPSDRVEKALFDQYLILRSGICFCFVLKNSRSLYRCEADRSAMQSIVRNESLAIAERGMTGALG